MTKYRADHILPARRPINYPRRPWHNDYDVLITTPNDRVDRMLAAGDWSFFSLRSGTDQSYVPLSRRLRQRGHSSRTSVPTVRTPASPATKSIISRVAESSAVPFPERSCVRASKVRSTRSTQYLVIPVADNDVTTVTVTVTGFRKSVIGFDILPF